jgi:nitronate monooxygenase
VPVSLLRDLGVDLPVIAAPMAGGPTTPALVAAAATAGSLGFLAAGYRSCPDLASAIATTRGLTDRFGVNVFVPTPVHAAPEEFRLYARAIAAEGEPYGLDLAAAAVREDDDAWPDKIDLLVAEPVPVVSFTFGLPEHAVIERLQRAGTLVVQTVTSAEEAGFAAAAGVDALAVQASTAGGHSGTFTARRLPAPLPLDHLLQQVRAVTDLPLLAAGGVGTPADVQAALQAGAVAVTVGTALLLADEAGTSATHRTAIAAATGGEPADRTVVTRAFTGRYARGLANAFTSRYDPIAPAGYPAIHHLTSPLRKAAAAAGDAERLHLWAGTGHRHCAARPVKDILTGLAEGS